MDATLHELFPPLERPTSGWQITSAPYDYQVKDHDETFRLWDEGMPGTMTRIFTGGGKTYSTCNKARTWLNRGPDYHVMIISYEKQLVWQFAQEVEDFLGIAPGIEMEAERIDPARMPRIVVASRASLLRKELPSEELIAELASLGITSVGACSESRCKSYLKALRRGESVESIYEDIERYNAQPEVKNGVYSRVHKFDHKLNWMIAFDEAHKHSYRMVSVGHIVDWFGQNPLSRRMGMTATPKRSDGVSLGDKMFPGIAIDYPLYHRSKPCAVKDGYAVPYVQKYIEVEGVDFKSIKQIAGDFDDADLERVLGEESTLAKLVEPLLDLVGDRKTLIFSPGVAMARNVACYINARCQASCPVCSAVKWHPTKLIGDGAECKCGRPVTEADIRKRGDQAQAIWGELSPRDRKELYRGHQTGQFQFLSVCGLCREGYNDPDIACVAVFRPVSKKASSLAEQMKGRGCRVLRGLIKGLSTPEERLKAIAESTKPNCLIVDLVGITGLADCASTVRIYADGVEDEVVERAERKLASCDTEMEVEEAINTAQKEIDDERDRIKKERLEAERVAKDEAEKRAKAGAQTRYTSHDTGVGDNNDPNGATTAQLRFISFLGMEILKRISRKQAGRIINQLRQRLPLEEIAMLNRIDAPEWNEKPPSQKQLGFMRWKGVPAHLAKSGYDASQLIDAKMNPVEYADKKVAEMNSARDEKELTAIAHDIRLVQPVIDFAIYSRLVACGKMRRQAFAVPAEF